METLLKAQIPLNNLEMIFIEASESESISGNIPPKTHKDNKHKVCSEDIIPAPQRTVPPIIPTTLETLKCV